MNKQLKLHGHELSNVATDDLVLKYTSVSKMLIEYSLY